MGKTTHSEKNLLWISRELKSIGIYDYRFCPENDCYICDIEGNFYSVCKRQYSKAGNFIQKYRIEKINGSVDKDGYRTYRITVDGVRKHLKGHRMMMNAWVGVSDDQVVNHKDGDKQNNALSNLEWCTVAENNAHAIRMGLSDPHRPNIKNCKIPCADWMSIYILNRHCGISFSELGRRNGCSHDVISKIVRRIDRMMGGVVCAG